MRLVGVVPNALVENVMSAALYLCSVGYILSHCRCIHHAIFEGLGGMLYVSTIVLVIS